MEEIGESEIGKLSLRYHPEVVDTPDRFRFNVRCLFREHGIVSGWVKKEPLEKLSDDGKQLFELTCVEVSGFGQPFEARVAKVVTDDPESVWVALMTEIAFFRMLTLNSGILALIRRFFRGRKSKTAI